MKIEYAGLGRGCLSVQNNQYYQLLCRVQYVYSRGACTRLTLSEEREWYRNTVCTTHAQSPYVIPSSLTEGISKKENKSVA